MFGTLKGNSLPLVKYDILWVLPIQFTMLYLRLFQREQGLTEVEIGTISSLQLVSQIGGALCGGYLAERWGRLRTVTWVDAIAWPLAFFVFASANSYISFMAGAILMGSVHLLVPSWLSLYIEKTPENRRPHLFAILHIPWFVASLLIPLSGLLVQRLGVSQTCRGVFAFSIFLTIFAVWYRGRFLRHADPPPKPFRFSIKEVEHLGLTHWRAFKAIASRKQMLPFLLMQMLGLSAMTTLETFDFLYITDPMGVGISKSSIAMLPFFQGTTTLAMIFLVLPHVTDARMFRALFAGLSLMALATIIVLAAPRGAFPMIMLAYALGPAGFALFDPALSSYWSQLMNDRERARIIALTTVLALIVAVPVPTIAGALYEINPRGPLFMVLAFYAVNFMLVFRTARALRARSRQSRS